MKLRLFASVAAMVMALSFSIASTDASAAKRFGGGKSSGMQRQAVTPAAAPSAPTAAGATSAAKAPTPATAGAPQAQPKRSWMGPLAGLAAGLGLAALASHFGFGDELASMMMIGLAVLAVMMVIGFIMRRRQGAGQGDSAATGAPRMAYAAAGQNQPSTHNAFERSMPASGTLAGGVGGTSGVSDDSANDSAAAIEPVGHIPADFDVAGFVRNAKLNFIRLQAANDAGNLDDIRDFTSPEMFAEIRLAIAERGGAKQETDVVSIDATVLDVADEAGRYVVSVRFVGLVREEADAQPQAIDEIWHLTKAKSGSAGWVVAGIQQQS